MDAESESGEPLFCTRETITILASLPWKMSTVPRSTYEHVAP